ncbi:MAG TPA: hypothetical protein VLM76_14630 [Patescibacteria group bacterium]|nr:hypothetical protein [Patescibacteria group bacterium]
MSMVGRILGRLRATGELREPARRRVSARQRRWRRPHAVRLPAAWPIERPGDLVELDTLDVRPFPGQAWKQFTARARFSRFRRRGAAPQRHGPNGGRRARRPRGADALPRPGDQR